MKTFVFIPDTKHDAGLGHLYRCYKYCNFINKKDKIIFLINKKFNKNFLIKENNNFNKIKYFFYNDLTKELKKIKLYYKSIYIFLDSYQKKIHKINFKLYSVKCIKILDFQFKSKADFIIDHTFKRKKNFHKKNIGSKIFVGHKFFPIHILKKNEKRDTILINFGSIKNIKLIIESLIFIDNLNLEFIKKIIIINNFVTKKNIPYLKISKKIFILKFTNNLEKFYRKSFFTIGACGISLYEKSFYNIPSISICVARNQNFNFQNFLSSRLILDLNKILNYNFKTKSNINKFLKSLHNLEIRLKKKFKYQENTKVIKKFFSSL